MRPSWMIMLILGVYVASLAVTGIVAPASRTDVMASVFTRAPVAALLHLGGGSLALVLGAFQVNRGFRERRRRLHRRMGALYLFGVVAAGCAGLPLAAGSAGGWVGHVGFGACALCWLGTTLMGAWTIWSRDFAAHERWMLRSYAVTLAAVMLRIYLPLSQVAGIPFETAYPIVAWLSWLPNLLVVESWLLPRATRRVLDA